MTELLYLTDTAIHSCDAQLVDLQHSDTEAIAVVSRSPFYPKGGGQASDTGRIVGAGGALEVLRVLRSDTGVLHFGKLKGRLDIGESVVLQVDVAGRQLNARLHTAGELICAAVHGLGRLWPVTAACHLLGQSRVAFATDLQPEDVDGFVSALRGRLGDLIDRNEPVIAKFGVSPEEVAMLCPLDSPAIGERLGPIRLISPTAGFYRPCMGAHVRHTGEVGAVTILKARLRSGELSLSYSVFDDYLPRSC